MHVCLNLWLVSTLLRLWINMSVFQPCVGSLFCVFGLGTSFCQCCAQPKGINGYWKKVGATCQNAGGEQDALLKTTHKLVVT